MNNLKVAVFGFSPHAHGAGVFAEDAYSHLIQRLGPNKEVIAQRTRQLDYNALTLSLSHRSLTVGLLYAPGGSALIQIRGAYMPGRETTLR